MTRVALSLGANLGDRVVALQHAVDVLSGLGEILGLSDVYETDPVGGPEQPEYYNAVVIVETDASPGEVLSTAQRAERGKGRTREVRWGPRTLDVDVLAFGDRVSADPNLTLPHPRATERAFVMIPWAQADPQFVLPDGRTVAAVRDAIADEGVRPLGRLLRTVER
jgi:2-amino-4-hydroxy-6-hydroxymethyldihydropteridine diphosphokinase